MSDDAGEAPRQGELASPSLASPSLASPSLASPSLASPSLASPSLASPSLASSAAEAFHHGRPDASYGREAYAFISGTTSEWDDYGCDLREFRWGGSGFDPSPTLGWLPARSLPAPCPLPARSLPLPIACLAPSRCHAPRRRMIGPCRRSCLCELGAAAEPLYE